MPPKANKALAALKTVTKLLTGLVLAAVAVFVIWGLFNLTTLKDWVILAGYKPPAEIAAIVAQDQMSAYAKTLFYVNRPAILNKIDFAKQCPNRLQESYVIGCYHSGDNGIYLLNVTDPRLNGIIPVTAAYEMLHAGYARLNSAERNSLDSAMWSYYEKYVSSPEIHQQMAAYAKTEPGAKYDELYSVLGTEVMNLSPTLERHYELYFKDRQAIVKTYQGYESEFSQRQQMIASYDLQLSSLKNQINANQSQLASWQSSLSLQSKQMKNLLNSGDYYGYNAMLPGYNSQVNQYNQLLNQTKAQIAQYNTLVSKRNSLVLEEQQLVQSINSSSMPSLTTK